MHLWEIKTTVELPDTLFRMAKAYAASEGLSLKRVFTDALSQHLERQQNAPETQGGPPWMTGFGELADLASEHKRVLGYIEEAFETVEAEDIQGSSIPMPFRPGQKERRAWNPTSARPPSSSFRVWCSGNITTESDSRSLRL